VLTLWMFFGMTRIFMKSTNAASCGRWSDGIDLAVMPWVPFVHINSIPDNFVCNCMLRD
jgi:hypothetical protein